MVFIILPTETRSSHTVCRAYPLYKAKAVRLPTFTFPVTCSAFFFQPPSLFFECCSNITELNLMSNRYSLQNQSALWTDLSETKLQIYLNPDKPSMPLVAYACVGL